MKKKHIYTFFFLRWQRAMQRFKSVTLVMAHTSTTNTNNANANKSRRNIFVAWASLEIVKISSGFVLGGFGIFFYFFFYWRGDSRSNYTQSHNRSLFCFLFFASSSFEIDLIVRLLCSFFSVDFDFLNLNNFLKNFNFNHFNMK